jgi:tetratricopeptide (TPR) repeat protein
LYKKKDKLESENNSLLPDKEEKAIQGAKDGNQEGSLIEGKASQSPDERSEILEKLNQILDKLYQSDNKLVARIRGKVPLSFFEAEIEKEIDAKKIGSKILLCLKEKIASRLYRKWKWKLLAIFVIVVVIVVTLVKLKPELLSPLGWSLPQKQRTVKILVAEFEGPDPQKYRVTDNILNEIRRKTEDYKDVEIVKLTRGITEGDGQKVARQIGQDQKADIVIWGWYGANEDNAQVSANFELLNPNGKLGEEAQGKVRTMAVAELKSFRIQTNLGKELTYLSLVTLGMSRYAAEDWDGTIARLTNAIGLVKAFPNAFDPSAIYFYRAVAYSHKGKKDWALTDYNNALKYKVNYPEARNNRGIIYDEKGEKKLAIVDYTKAIDLNPYLAEPLNNRGLIYSKEGKEDLAIINYNKALDLNPNSAESHNNRGIYYSKKGKVGLAIVDYNEALKLKPNSAEYHNNRGFAFYKMGQNNLAINDYNKALKINSTLAEVYGNRGLISYEQGNFTEAMSDWQKAISIDGSLAEPQMALAVTLYQEGDAVAAKSLAKKALQLDKRYSNLQFLKKEAIWSDKILQQAAKFFSESGI